MSTHREPVMPSGARSAATRPAVRRNRTMHFFRAIEEMQPEHQSPAALNEDELVFLWKSLVEEGKLSVDKLQMFMQTMAGVRMSTVQTKDLLSYMDANGDGRVGMEDFKNFLSICHLSDTDVKSFMWEPKKKFQEESRAHDRKISLGSDGGHQAEARSSSKTSQQDAKKSPATYQQGAKKPHQPVQPVIRHDRDDCHEHTGHGRKMMNGPDGGHRPLAESPMRRGTTMVPPQQDVNKRPQNLQREETSTGQAAAMREESQAKTFAGRRSVVRKNSQDTCWASSGSQNSPTVAGVTIPKKVVKPPPLTPEVEKKIELALLKYEKKSWDKFLAEEKIFKRQLFEQFSGEGNDDLSPSQYHKMLTKWMPLASWCVSRGLRPTDSLAALEYVQSRHREDRGQIPRAVQPVPRRRSSGMSAVAPSQQLQQAGDTSSPAELELAPATEATMTFGLWLEVLNGKHKPEEHISEEKSNLAHPLDC